MSGRFRRIRALVWKVTSLSSHIYSVGQTVRANGAGSALAGRSAFRIVALLPPLGQVNQYRVRNAAEQHDRIMTESQLQTVIEAAEAEAAAVPQPEEGSSPWPRAKSVAIGNPRNPRRSRH